MSVHLYANLLESWFIRNSDVSTNLNIQGITIVLREEFWAFSLYLGHLIGRELSSYALKKAQLLKFHLTQLSNSKRN